jgi:hypothetical protein
VSVPANEEPERNVNGDARGAVNTASADVSLAVDAIQASAAVKPTSTSSAVPEQVNSMPRMLSGNAKQRPVARGTQPGAVNMTSETGPDALSPISASPKGYHNGTGGIEVHDNGTMEPEPIMAPRRTSRSNRSEGSSNSSQTASKGRRTTAPATAPGAIHAMTEEPGRDGELTRNLSVASSTSSQASSKGCRSTAPATAPGAVHASAEEPGRDGELTPRSSSKVPVPQSGKGRRSTAQAALVPGAVAVGNVEPQAASDATHSQNTSPAQQHQAKQRSLGSFDRSVGAMPLGALPPRVSESPPAAVAADMPRTNAAYEPVVCPGAAGSRSVEGTGLVDAPDTLSNADTTLASNSTMTASQDSAAKGRNARSEEPSVPGAHHVAATQEDSPDSIAMVKDPRMRHEAQQLGGDSVKSRMAARAEKVTAAQKEASPTIGPGQSEPSNKNSCVHHTFRLLFY